MEDSSLLQEAGVSTVSLWMPLFPEHMPDAVAWLAVDVVSKVERWPHLGEHRRNDLVGAHR
jgi:hypothetical protein